MKKIFVTGATGFIGRNILPILKEDDQYFFYTPTRAELNLKDEGKVREYLEKHSFDIVLHLANPTPAKNELDSFDRMMEDSVRIFMNLYNNRDLYGKMIYTGSGAEFDKSKDMNEVGETDCYRSVPYDQYGLAKMVMNYMAEYSDNVYNFRVMGCYGPTDHESKFITHCIRSVLLGIPITIRKDCKFDYMHVYDLARYIKWGIDNDLKYHDYNMSSGECVLLSDIAKEVVRQMESDLPIKLLSDEYNNNYTANNKRLVAESGISIEYPIKLGIAEQIKWEKDNWTENTKFDGK